MTQLVYHPAFDAYHAFLRSVRILLACPDGLDPMALRILDFFLLFPERIETARLTPALRSLVKRTPIEPRFPYDTLPASRPLFSRMAEAQEAAAQTLLAKGLARAEGDKVRLLGERVPAQLLDLCAEQNENESSLMETLKALAAAFPTQGANGLKDRSGLAEFRYDVA